jgi:hypothetical protein
MTRASVATVVLFAFVGCGSGSSSGTQPSRAASTSPAAAVPKMPNPCRDPKGFIRAMKRLEKRGDASVSPNARHALRLLAQNGSANCSSISSTDTFTTTK